MVGFEGRGYLNNNASFTYTTYNTGRYSFRRPSPPPPKIPSPPPPEIPSPTPPPPPPPTLHPPFYRRKRSSNLIEIHNGIRTLHIGNKTYILGKARKPLNENKKILTNSLKVSDPTHPTKAIFPQSADGYSIMLTSVCFVHYIYLEMFFDPLIVPSGVLQFIDEKRNCEDIMLSVLVTKFLQDISWPQCGVLVVKPSFRISNLDQEASEG